MRIALVIVAVVSIASIVALRMSARTPEAPKRTRQGGAPGVETQELPDPGSDETARRSDGRLMPGSEEYRNRQGKP